MFNFSRLKLFSVVSKIDLQIRYESVLFLNSSLYLLTILYVSISESQNAEYVSLTLILVSKMVFQKMITNIEGVCDSQKYFLPHSILFSKMRFLL